ncbi:ABC transporter permease [Inquilinus sp.]|jgi:ribose transport system permease protein|uniref:ABC transporter permease n=1 Tax=Inquilinus sp. TaxID=1932117 RepID=UPI0037837319
MTALFHRLSRQGGLLLAIGLFVLFYGLYSYQHPRGGSADLIVQNANETFALALVAMAQTVPVLLGGLDLSVGPLMTMVNCLASHLLTGSGWDLALGIVLCLCAGLLAGFINGALVVYGRIQPIIATLATGAVLIGIALFLRPTPGGAVDSDLSWAATNTLFDVADTYGWWGGDLPGWFRAIQAIPVPAILIVLVVLLVWLPFKNSVTGRGCYAIGSSEQAAYMSGVAIDRSKLAAFTLAGFFAAVAGVYLALQTGSGNADTPMAGAYTLNAIAAVVIGGTSLFGGAGGAVASIVGVMVLRAISFCFRVVPEDSALGFLANPLLQPLFEGVILLAAVSLGAARVFTVKNRLQLFG